jgi:crossover junction endodeoxyribonuclease RuvC
MEAGETRSRGAKNGAGRRVCGGGWTSVRKHARRANSAVHLFRMRVFGIDCGTEVTGFGVVESDENAREPRLECCALGAIRLARTERLPVRLEQVFRELTAELERWRPDTVAIEEVFYSVNAKSALKLGQVRGVALLAAAMAAVPVAEYAPLKIKSSVVGYGLAKKEQVQFMVARLLRLSVLPQPADAADALAIAICHVHTAQTLAMQGVGQGIGQGVGR